MRKRLMQAVGLLVVCAMFLVGCDGGSNVQAGDEESPSSPPHGQPASLSGDDELSFVEKHAGTRFAHIRLRIWADADYTRIDEDGRIEVLEHLAETVPLTVDFWVPEGEEVLKISDAGDGRRIALYLEDVKFQKDHVRAKRRALAMNFGFKPEDLSSSATVRVRFKEERHQSSAIRIGYESSPKALAAFEFESLDPGTKRLKVWAWMELIGIKPLSEVVQYREDLVVNATQSSSR